MNGTERSRIDLWLFITAAVVLFRVMTFLVEMVTSTLGVMLARIPYAVICHIIAALPVLSSVVAVALAVLIARAVEPRLLQMDLKRKRFLLAILAVLSLLPWQLQIRTTA